LSFIPIRNERTWIAYAVVVLLAGCGGARQTTRASEGATPSPEASETATAGGADVMMVPPSVEEQETVSSFDDDVATLEAELSEAMTLADGPDCDSAEDLRDSICDLSERICGISDRHPDWNDVAAKCEEGRDRCERARSDVSEHCE